MTDNNIIKALECEIRRAEYTDTEYLDCVEVKDFKLALDLILRQRAEKEALINGQESLQKYIAEQKAEIERLERTIEDLESIQEISPEAKYLVDTKADKVISLMNEILKSQEQIKAEAITEFEQRLKKEAGYFGRAVAVDTIDQIAKEMKGEQE